MPYRVPLSPSSMTFATPQLWRLMPSSSYNVSRQEIWGEPWRLEASLLLHGSRLFISDHGDLRHQALLLAHSLDMRAFRRCFIASTLIFISQVAAL